MLLPSYFNVHFSKIKDFGSNNKWIRESHWNDYLVPKVACYVSSSSPRKISEMGTARLALPANKKDPRGFQCIPHRAVPFTGRSRPEHSCLDQSAESSRCHTVLLGWPVATVTGTRSLMTLTMGACSMH